MADVKVEEVPKVEVDAEGVPVVAGKTAEEVKAGLAQATRQVNFYFSDSNLPVDRFFFSLTACNPEGWVPLKTILTFKRMKEFQEFGLQTVAHALREQAKEEGSDALLAISEDGQNVRRSRPLEPDSTAWSRSAYVKGFGEGDSEDNSLPKIEEYFDQFGKINAIRMRRGDIDGKGEKGKGRGTFKGSVFVEFAYETDMNKYLELSPIPKFTEDGPEMLAMTKDAYVKMKAKEKGIPETDITKGKDRKVFVGATTGKFNAFREMDRMKAGMKPYLAKIPNTVEVVGKPVPVAEGGDKFERKSKKRDREDGDDEGKEGKQARTEPLILEYKGVTLDIDQTTGQVLDVSKIPFNENSAVKFAAPGEGADWKELKTAIVDTGLTNPFVAFPPSSKQGTIARGDGETITDEEFAALQGANIEYGGQAVTFTRMTEDELRAFWATRANWQGSQVILKAQREESNGGKERRPFHGGNRGRGGFRGGNRGRGGGHRGNRGGHRGGNRGGNRGDRRDRGEGKGGAGVPPSVGAVQAD